MAELDLAAQSPFAGLLSSGGPMRISDRSQTCLATVIARRGQSEALRIRLLERFGIDLATGPRRSGDERLALVGMAPDRYLAIGDTDNLARELGGIAYTFDQSGAFGVLRLAGPEASNLLSMSISIDLHPDVFVPNMAATTALAHIGITLWRLPDGDDGSPAYELAVSRSLAAALWHHLIGPTAS